MWGTHEEKMGRKEEGGNWMSVECTAFRAATTSKRLACVSRVRSGFSRRPLAAISSSSTATTAANRGQEMRPNTETDDWNCCVTTLTRPRQTDQTNPLIGRREDKESSR